MLKQKILALRESGYSYNQISKELKCSKGTISYHCNDTQKEKTSARRIKSRNNAHPYSKKLENYLSETKLPKVRTPTHKTKSLLRSKLQGFFMDHESKEYTKPKFTIEDVINKFGENPRCYLTGDPIDINKPRTYSFDHIIPRSRGGQNTLENLGLCTRAANSAKSDMTPDELVALCKKIIKTLS